MNAAALTAHLEQRGLTNPDGVHRWARYTRCPHCTRQVLIGLDADGGGLPRTVDTVDLDRIAEVLVLATGRPTFRIFEIGNRLRIARREPWVIRAQQQDRPVVAAHDCAQPSPPSTAWRWRIPTQVPDTDQPPF